jgi:hypothetical protein
MSVNVPSSIAVNEMVTPTPCEGYAFAGCFIFGGHHHERSSTGRYRLGKHTYRLLGQDKSGRELFRKKSSRQQMMRFFGTVPACTVVMEACAGSHYVARELMAMGHQAKPISPQFVKPFVKSPQCQATCRPC